MRVAARSLDPNSQERLRDLQFLLRLPKTAVLSALPRSAQASLLHLRSHGRLPNLSEPLTFTEKLAAAKVRQSDPRMPVLADKVAAKEHVARLIGSEWITPTLFSGPRLPPPADRNWPTPYVIKANNGSGTNIFVTKPPADWRAIEIMTARWMRQRPGATSGDWYYTTIPPLLLVEPMIGGGSPPEDYKFFVFNGRAEFVQVDTGRFTDHRRTFFDRDWKQQPFTMSYPPSAVPLPRPPHFAEMLEASEALAQDFPFVRIDLYDTVEGPRFGEYSFYPGSGTEPFAPPQFEAEIGRLWTRF